MTNNTIIKVQMYGPLYKRIDNYEYLIPIAATAAIGGTCSFSLAGVIAGGALGGIDVIANYYKIYDKPYLTSATLGWGMLSAFKAPYYIADAAGIIIGLLLPTGVIYPHLDKAIALVSASIAGYCYMGPIGFAVGFTAEVIDETLSGYNVTHKYPLTNIANNMAISNIALPQLKRVIDYISPTAGEFKLTDVLNNKLLHEVFALAISAISLSYTSEEKSKSPALQLNDDLYTIYRKIIPNEAQLNAFIITNAISVLTGNIIAAKMNLAFNEHYQKIADVFPRLVQTDASWGNFLNVYTAFAKYIPTHVLSFIANYYINHFFQTRFKYIFNDEFHNGFLKQEVLLHLKQSREQNAINDTEEFFSAEVLFKNIDNDMYEITRNGLIPNALSTTINGIYAIGHLFSINALDMVLFSSVYNKLTSFITHQLSENVYSYEAQLSELFSQLKSKYTYAHNNAEAMIIYGANSFTKASRDELSITLREALEEQSMMKIINDLWSHAKDNIDFLFCYLVVADKIYQGSLSNDKRIETTQMTNDFSNMAGWDASNAGEISMLRQSMARVLELNSRMEEVDVPLTHLTNYHYETKDQPGICFNDFKVGKGEESRLFIKDLCVFHQRIAVTSASGGGKSTLFKAIKQITHNEVWSEGNITYFSKNANVPYIAMTSQNEYIPPAETLLELITFKKGASAQAYREKVIELLTKIKIDKVKENEVILIENLDEQKNWSTELSGGQKQKIDAIRLMLQPIKPDIILFDEVFAGLDHESIDVLQAMLDEELPDTQIFIIDHEAKNHNKHNFYDAKLHLSGGAAELTFEV
jgi:ABC-type uncharacterized transport system fused permease/ATPase subunit